MLPNIDPKQMQQMLKQLGMKMEDVSASQVVIKTDSGNITINDPKVVKTIMKGQVIYQVSGQTQQEAFSEEDIELVMEQSGVKDKEKIKETLEQTKGDVVEAIMKLKS